MEKPATATEWSSIRKEALAALFLLLLALLAVAVTSRKDRVSEQSVPVPVIEGYEVVVTSVKRVSGGIRVIEADLRPIQPASNTKSATQVVHAVNRDRDGLAGTIANAPPR